MIETVLHSHISRYPAMQIQDLYKLLHQAAMGSEHAVSEPVSAGNRLFRELAEMEAGIPEPMIDPISADHAIVRVHLRPYVAAKRDPQVLLDGFIRTANEYRGDAQLLEQYWQIAVTMTIFPLHAMLEFFRDRKAANYPAIHHSPIYKKLYHPAYRVISVALCPQI